MEPSLILDIVSTRNHMHRSIITIAYFYKENGKSILMPVKSFIQLMQVYHLIPFVLTLCRPDHNKDRQSTLMF